MNDLRILISGYFGAKNLGDDLMIVEFCEYLNKKNKNISVTILKLFPHIIEGLPPNVKIIDLSSIKRGRGPIFKYLILPQYDGIYWVGGTCFTDTEGDGFYRYMNIALKQKKRIGYINVGIGHITCQDRINKMQFLLNNSSFASFRDVDSYNIAKKHNEDFVLTEDLVYLGAEKYRKIEPDGVNAVICWRNLFGYMSYEEEKNKIDSLIDFLRSIENQYTRIQVLVIDDSVDYQASQYIYDHIKYTGKAELYSGCSLEKKCELILSARLNITARLHGIVLSEIAGIKTIAISYSPKIDSFLESIGHKEDEIKVGLLSKDNLWEAYNKESQSIDETYIKKRKKCAEDGIDAFLGFLEGKVD